MMFNIDDAITTSIKLVKPGIIASGINNFIKKTNKLPTDKRKKIVKIIYLTAFLLMYSDLINIDNASFT